MDELVYPLSDGAKFSDSFLRNAGAGQGRRPPPVQWDIEPSTSSGSAAVDSNPRTGSLSRLTGLSAEILQGMEDEIDDAFNDNDDTEEEEDPSTVSIRPQVWMETWLESELLLF